MTQSSESKNPKLLIFKRSLLLNITLDEPISLYTSPIASIVVGSTLPSGSDNTISSFY